MSLSASFRLSALDGSNGFRLDGIDPRDASGSSVASVGDVNGDGIADLIIGASGADPQGRDRAGETYVVFGSDAGFPASLSLAALDGANGFRLDGIDADDQTGRSVASAGDVNGDGIDDLVIGGYRASPEGRNFEGETYVVFGSDAGFPASLSLAALDGANGFRLVGSDAFDLSGWSVASAGDVNGDGIDDLIIGAVDADPEGRDRAGETYVVFGSDAGFAASLSLSALDGTNGFRLMGIDLYDQSGHSVASAGDVNGDGIDDVIIGVPNAGPQGRERAGESYVIFGSTAGFSASLALADLDGANGFRLDGIDGDDSSGHSVASAGDVNGDGFDDVIIGAWLADAGGRVRAGKSYVVFGSDAGFPASLSLAALDGSNGFRLDGMDVYDLSGWSVASAGDVNGDGVGDLLIGAGSASPEGRIEAGETYLIFGNDAGFPASLSLSALDGVNGVRLDGIDAYDRSGGSVAPAGDVNGDGIDDLIIGAADADPGGHDRAGETYVFFGSPTLGQLPQVTGTEGPDVLIRSQGSEKIDARGGNDWILPGAGPNIIDGGEGFDMVSYAGRTGPLTHVQSAAQDRAYIDGQQDRLSHIEGVTGTSQADTFYFDTGTARGLGGADRFFAAGQGTGHYEGGAGRDTMDYRGSTAGVAASLFRDRGWEGDAAGDTYDGIENLTGSNFDDRLWGDNSANVIQGLYGDDTIVGAGGDDYILAGFGRDVIVYSGARADYTITRDGFRTVVEHLDGGVDGTDVIGHAEVLRFADGDFLL